MSGGLRLSKCVLTSKYGLNRLLIFIDWFWHWFWAAMWQVADKLEIKMCETPTDRYFYNLASVASNVGACRWVSVRLLTARGRVGTAEDRPFMYCLVTCRVRNSRSVRCRCVMMAPRKECFHRCIDRGELQCSERLLFHHVGYSRTFRT